MDSSKTLDFYPHHENDKDLCSFQGIYMVVNSSRISVGTKLLLSMSFWCWLTLPLSVVNLVLSKIFIVRTSPIIDLILSMVGGMVFFMYLVGYLKQHHVKRYGTTSKTQWKIRNLVLIPFVVDILGFKPFSSFLRL